MPDRETLPAETQNRKAVAQRRMESGDIESLDRCPQPAAGSGA